MARLITPVLAGAAFCTFSLLGGANQAEASTVHLVYEGVEMQLVDCFDRDAPPPDRCSFPQTMMSFDGRIVLDEDAFGRSFAGTTIDIETRGGGLDVIVNGEIFEGFPNWFVDIRWLNFPPDTFGQLSLTFDDDRNVVAWDYISANDPFIFTSNSTDGDWYYDNFFENSINGSPLDFEYVYDSLGVTGSFTTFVDGAPVAPIPLPAGILLLIGGLGVLGVLRRRR